MICFGARTDWNNITTLLFTDFLMFTPRFYWLFDFACLPLASYLSLLIFNSDVIRNTQETLNFPGVDLR